MMHHLLHNLARGPKQGEILHPLNLLKTLFWCAPGLAVLAYIVTH